MNILTLIIHFVSLEFVGTSSGASASAEGKIPTKNAQTGKGPILPNAPLGAAAAASASVYSAAAGGDDNEVLGNTL